MARPDDPERVDVVRPQDEIGHKTHPDRENEEAEQKTQPLAADALPARAPELRTDHAAHHQDQSQHGIDQVIGRGMQYRGRRHGEKCQDHRRADHRRRRHPQQVDQHRHEQKTAADAHDRADEAYDETDDHDRDRGYVDFRSFEPHLQRQAVEPGVTAGTTQFGGHSPAPAHDRAHTFGDHQRADSAEKGHIGQLDDEIELVERAQPREQENAAGAAEDTAGKERQGEGKVERIAPPVGDRAGERGGGDVGRNARDRHRRLHADENQKRRHQEPAAYAEHAGNEPDREAHRQHQEDVDG